MRIIKQSTSANVMVFMTSSTDHITGLAALTLTITASKDGGAFSAIAPTVTDRGSGWYNLALTSSETDTFGDLCLHITSAGADPSDLKLLIVAYDSTSATNLGLTNLDAAISTRLATSGYTAPDNAGIAALPLLSEIEASTILAKEVTVASRASQASLDDVHADVGDIHNDVGEIKNKTDNLPSDPADQSLLEAAIATRMATFTYTAPDNAGITAIKAKTDNLPADPADESLLEAAIATRMAASSYVAPDNDAINALPTLVEIEASTVLAKEATVNSRLASSAYTAPDNATIASIDSKIDDLPTAEENATELLNTVIP